jgi:hypothetical protein
MQNLPKTKEDLQKFLANYSPKEIRNALESFPLGWFLVHKIKTSVGLPFEFKKRRFMRAIVNDLHPKQVVLKPPQVGASETFFVKLFFVAAKLKKAIIYTLPSQTDVEDMVGGKFNPIIAQNPILQRLTHDHDTIYQKKIGNMPLYLRGTVGKTQAMMVSSGLNVHDEIDASDLPTITQYENRQEAQEREEDKWRWYFSHPSLAGLGIDTYWQKSDKREWIVTCPHCTQQQTLIWPESVSRDKEAFVCRKCDGELPTEARIKGFWHPTAKGEYHGYHVSQLMLYNKTAKDILNAFDDPLKDKQFFYNYVLGLPYAGGDDQITVEQVLKNCDPETNSQQGKIIIGVDPGLPVHYVCMNAEGLFFYGICSAPSEKNDGYEEIRMLMRKWPTAVVVSDQGGDLNPMRKMQFEFPGRVFIAYYRKPKKSNELWEWGEGDDFGQVTIDRNRVIQVIVGELKETGRLKLNGTPQEWQEYADHWAAMYREKIIVKEAKDKDDRSLYGAEYVWKRRRADHYAHATVYAHTGLMKYGKSMASTTSPDIFSTLQVGVADDKFTGEVILRALSENSPF